MSANIEDLADGILTLMITGKLTQPELTAVQQATVEAIRKQGKVRILVIAEDFQGWEKGGDWGDLTAQMEMDPYVEKMAIVCAPEWEDLAIVFTGKGFRKFPIEHFQPADVARARAWLAANE